MASAGSIEALMARYQQGDSAAVAALVNRVGPQLHRFFLAQSAGRGLADDLLQETWMRIHQARHTYRAGEPALPWIYAIARHVRVDHYRKSQRTSPREKRFEEASEGSSATEPIGIPTVDALLARLPDSQREVISLLKLCGMSLEEVARATSGTVGSVKQKAHRAYEKLRELAG